MQTIVAAVVPSALCWEEVDELIGRAAGDGSSGDSSGGDSSSGSGSTRSTSDIAHASRLILASLRSIGSGQRMKPYEIPQRLVIDCSESEWSLVYIAVAIAPLLPSPLLPSPLLPSPLLPSPLLSSPLLPSPLLPSPLLPSPLLPSPLLPSPLLPSPLLPSPPRSACSLHVSPLLFPKPPPGPWALGSLLAWASLAGPG
jgi:hypothetical protein